MCQHMMMAIFICTVQKKLLHNIASEPPTNESFFFCSSVFASCSTPNTAQQFLCRTTRNVHLFAHTGNGTKGDMFFFCSLKCSLFAITRNACTMTKTRGHTVRTNGSVAGTFGYWRCGHYIAIATDAQWSALLVPDVDDCDTIFLRAIPT